jgi:hypothetical protein
MSSDGRRGSDDVKGFPSISKTSPIVGYCGDCPRFESIVDWNFNNEGDEQGDNKQKSLREKIALMENGPLWNLARAKLMN